MAHASLSNQDWPRLAGNRRSARRSWGDRHSGAPDKSIPARPRDRDSRRSASVVAELLFGRSRSALDRCVGQCGRPFDKLRRRISRMWRCSIGCGTAVIGCPSTSSGALVSQVLAGATPPAGHGRMIRLIDATAVPQKGARARQRNHVWRIHSAFQLPAERFGCFVLTDQPFDRLRRRRAAGPHPGRDGRDPHCRPGLYAARTPRCGIGCRR